MRRRALYDIDEHRPPSRGLADFGVTTAAVIGAVVAAAAGTAGSLVSSQAAASQADYQEKVANQQAEQARQAGAAAERATRDRAARIQAEQRAAIGAGGIQTEGTPLAVLLDTSRQAELDALTARSTGQVNAYGAEAAAGLYRQRKSYAQQAGIYGAGRTLLTGAGNIAGAYAGPGGSSYGAGPGKGLVGFSGYD